METKFFIIIAFIFTIILLAIILEPWIMSYLNKIPFGVSKEYLKLKSLYGCNYCFASTEICKETNSSKQIYTVRAGSFQGNGRNIYLDYYGNLMCSSKWGFSDCKGGCPDDFTQGVCPQVQECKVIIEWEGKDR